jgi:hypothetical protein
MREVLGLILLSSWIGGVVFAKGGISVFFAVIFPFYAWYLVIERIMQLNGMV